MAQTSPSPCVPRGPAPVRERHPFPLFPGEPRIDGPIRRSRSGRRRALVLGAVHVAILGHVAHWLARGRTLSPVEPSEAMETLELGRVNAGFVFFALAILSTLVFGRFFCGWGCHLVALQDLCAWLLRRMGLRPRPFRSRVLVWAPLGLAAYMFLWPTVERLLVTRHAFPGFASALTTENLWETFPSVWIAVPFLAICGFATVLLLGAKGFCTYGCPYGAVFAAADAVAPGRIRVTEACNGCGHCTAVCTSNVRVHENVREFGMVVDPGCMKCQDCVSVCPNDALYFGFGRPAVAAGAPRSRGRTRAYDLSPAGEAAAALSFLAVLLCFRGLYDAVPLLMAVGIAACATWLGWTALRLLRDSGVSWHGVPLRRDGRLLPGGHIVLALGVVVAAATAHSGVVQASRAAAQAWDRRVTVHADVPFREDRPPLDRAQLAAARAAEANYRRADEISAGGLGLAPTPEVVMRRAWLALVLSEPRAAAGHLRRAAALAGEPRVVRLDLARVLALAGDRDGALAELRRLIAEDPADAAPHRLLAGLLEESGALEEAAASLVAVVNLAPDDADARARLVGVLTRLGRPQDAARYR
jgi:NAD-dependent dihydropyrimidine dehydrogenase PreA subunit